MNKAGANPNVAMDATQIARTIKRISLEIAEHNNGASIALVGILRRGAALAERIALELRKHRGADAPVGTIDISSYRDDGRGRPGDPKLIGKEIPFSIEKRHVVLVDDVLYTGRTVRAALEALADLGRAESVQLAVLIDRGDHELPIRADYVGKNISAPRGQRVFVRVAEIDGSDAVVIGDSR